MNYEPGVPTMNYGPGVPPAGHTMDERFFVSFKQFATKKKPGASAAGCNFHSNARTGT